ncbi:hypothetical protein M0R89_07420 [Halorussus limi]|uniref:Uncharacterized protein n=1 Tax=Halorussus limi TaxID=2938695 RepID=A0A8U0HY79_9EURY|nr:hypothetical protein [Halorussus limi]UPV75878.1 hypothetical protein M0R89_07420 [Halorussus limi]
MSSDAVFGDGLLSQFSNVRVALQDRVVAKPGRSVFHRIDPTADPDEPTATCRAGSADTDWQAADLETVRRSGLEPCRSCYESILEFLAQQPESPVEFRTNSATDPCEIGPTEPSVFDPVVKPTVPALGSLTSEVLVQHSSTDVMHAPTPDGPLCDQSGDFRRVERKTIETHYRPCRDCFDLDTT